MRTNIIANETYLAFFDSFHLQMTGQAIIDCSASGPVDDAVEFWSKGVKRPLEATRAAIRKECAETGAWEGAELDDDDLNWRRVIWMAAGNVLDELCFGLIRKASRASNAL
jgi:hypothetical protein